MRTPRATLAIGLAGLCLAGTAGGCGHGQKSPEASVREVWSSVQRGTRLGRDRVSIVAAGGRQIICYSIAPALRQQLATVAGEPRDYLPRCLFLRRVPLLDGSRTLGDLQGLRVERDGTRVIAHATVSKKGKTRPVTVRFGKLNHSNWVVTSIRTLHAIPPGQPLEPDHPRATVTTAPPSD